jgi:hypothetical protein
MVISFDAIKVMRRVGAFVAAATMVVGVPSEVRAKEQDRRSSGTTSLLQRKTSSARRRIDGALLKTYSALTLIRPLRAHRIRWTG